MLKLLRLILPASIEATAEGLLFFKVNYAQYDQAMRFWLVSAGKAVRPHTGSQAVVLNLK